MSLTKKQLEARSGRLTASRVACLMSGDKAKILNLWKEMIGDPSFVPEDLSDNWPVQFGDATEAINLQWYEKKYNRVIRKGEVVIHQDNWMACTLDGWDMVRNCPIECKTVGGFEKRETVIQRYMPQMHWQMLVTNAPECAISIIEGGREPIVEYVPMNAEYAEELLKRASQFMEAVNTLTPPVILDPVASPIKAEKVYDMTGKNTWAAAAAQWLENRRAAKMYEDAAKELKDLVPADAKRAHGHNIEIVRDKANRLKIGEA